LKNNRLVGVLVLLFIWTGGLSSQVLPLSMREDFDDNRRGWDVGSRDGVGAEVADGRYKVVKNSPRGEWFFLTDEYINYDRDFDISTAFRVTGGSRDHSVGIVWGAVNAENANIFSVSSAGNFKAWHVYGQAVADLYPWSTSGEIRTDGSTNVMEVRKRGSWISLVVNGSIVATIEPPMPFGGKIGFSLGRRIAAEIDYLEVRQDSTSINLAPDHPVNVVKESLGTQINSQGADLSPVISVDGKRLWFGRYPHPQNVGNPDGEDVWYSDRKKDGSWGPAINPGPPLNNEGANFIISISPDGNTALVGNTYYPDGRPKGTGISMATRTDSGWTVPVPVEIDNYYNRDRYVEMSLDPSGRVLVMAVSRRDANGRRDLYVSFRKDNGGFGEPVNMGPVINSWGNENSPFIAADGMTLYFSTDGFKGYGGSDIFMSRRLDDTWRSWSTPMNLGPAINSKEWDAYYTVPAKGDFAYLCGVDPVTKSADIFRVKLTQGVRPQPVVLVTGRVLDAVTKKPITTQVVYESLTKRKTTGEARSSPTTGEFTISLPSGDLYGFRAEAPGYYPVSEQLDTRKLDSYSELQRDLLLVPINAGTTITLKNVFFDSGKWDLREESQPELDRLVSFLNKDAAMRIEVAGYTDNVGNDADNILLSQHRVDAVKAYLIDKGIADARLKAVGYGKVRPVASNASEDGRQRNRRVEFRIIRK